MQIETFNHAESTGDAKKKQAHSYELTFAENKKFVNSKFGAHLFKPFSTHCACRQMLFVSSSNGLQ
jgi:hypothetical protein